MAVDRATVGSYVGRVVDLTAKIKSTNIFGEEVQERRRCQGTLANIVDDINTNTSSLYITISRTDIRLNRYTETEVYRLADIESICLA